MLSSRTDPDILVTEIEAPEQGKERNRFITAICNRSRGQDDGFLPGEVSGPKRVCTLLSSSLYPLTHTIVVTYTV